MIISILDLPRDFIKNGSPILFAKYKNYKIIF